MSQAQLIYWGLRRIREEHYKDSVPSGRLARFHKPLQTPEQRRAADVAASHAHFTRLGWSRTDVETGQVDRQLDALTARARAMQEHAKRLENLAPHARAFQAPPNFTYAVAFLPSISLICKSKDKCGQSVTTASCQFSAHSARMAALVKETNDIKEMQTAHFRHFQSQSESADM